MGKVKSINNKSKYKALNIRLTSYLKKVAKLYSDIANKASSIAALSDFDADSGKEFSFSEYPELKGQVEDLRQLFAENIYTTIKSGINSEWQNSNEVQDMVADKVLQVRGVKSRGQKWKHYYQANNDAKMAFLKRKDKGLSLSDKIWSQSADMMTELELALSTGIERGMSAVMLSKRVSKYLNDFDKLKRDYSERFGKAINTTDCEYRSMRLVRSEINMAYRTAEQKRWEQMDFIVGYEIKRSGGFKEDEKAGRKYDCDICEALKGKYPKDFIWTGWHPNCRCYKIPIMKTEEEFWNDTETTNSQNAVTDVPEGFKLWLQRNDSRITRASSIPYFITDNPKYSGIQLRYGAVGAVTGTKLGRAATRAAFKVYEDMPAPSLTEEVMANTAELAKDFGIKTQPKPMTFLEANKGQANVSWGKSSEFEENCQAAVAVHEARLRGLNVTALGYDYSEGSISRKLGDNFERIWQHPKTGKTPTPTTLRGTDFDTLIGKVAKQTEATGRYHIGINMAGDKGHIISAERLSDGRIIYYDAQNGAFLKLEEYANLKVEYFEVLKVDKLLLRRDLFTKIARWL